MKLALGTAQFGLNYGISNSEGRTSTADVEKILKLANKFGVDTIDTAASYGCAEKVLGQFSLSNFKVVSKLPPLKTVSAFHLKKWFHLSFQEILDKLNNEFLYGLMFHRSESIDIGNVKLINEICQEYRQKGLITKIGVSVYSPDELVRLNDIGFEYQITQVPLNIIDRRFLESGCIRTLRKKNVEIHSRSCFLQGLLLMSPGKRPRYFDRWRELFIKWDDYLLINNLRAAEVCIAFLSNIEQIDKIVVGVNNLGQFEELLEIYEKMSTLDSSLPDIASNDQFLINPSLWDF